RQGQWIYYRLHPQLPEWVLHVLQITRSANQSWIDQDASRLALMEDRPVRQAACC
ncbi:transcriptional regulator, partial [Pseudomonas coleopterorum]|nr:transcriptional regulator [Pseudomonas coleopterorum]